jgi:predicted outer membrane repeat protein/parallel beta-helix repeat protein
MADPETFERFVDGLNGADTTTGGRTASAKPLKTITAALSQLVTARSGPGQRLTVRVATGTYREHLTLVDNLLIVGTDARKTTNEAFPSVRILRGDTASIQGTTDTAPPTAEDVISIRGNDIEVVGLFIDGDNRPQHGISILKSARVTIAGCRIANCKARIYHPKFAGTQADPLGETPVRQGKGAGLIINGSSNVLVTGCVFSDNGNALTFRKRIYNSIKQRIFDQASLQEQLALKLTGKLDREANKIEPIRDSGGAHVEMERVDEIRFEESLFEKGFCSGRGGALHAFKDAFFHLKSCEFRDNRAATDGGGVAINNEAFKDPKRKLITISDCVFERNFAGDDGGGIYATSKTLLKLTNCKIENNKANTNGGGLRVSFGSEVTAEGCTFSFNENNVDAATKAEDNRDGGGAIAVANSSLTLDGCRLVSNTTHGFAGAGLYFITTGYDENAERGAKLSHGETFEDILKSPAKFNFKKCVLLVKGTIIFENRTPADTFYGEPENKRLKGGAGAGIYVLEHMGSKVAKPVGIPIEVVIDGSTIQGNKSEHRDDEQKAEMVFRAVSSLKLVGETVVKHPDNKFLYSLFKVKAKDMAGSTTFAAGVSGGTVLDK